MAPPPLEAKTPDTKQSIEEMLQELMPGQRFEVVPRVTNLGNGIQATRAAFASSWFSEEGCGKGQARLSNYRKKWDQRNGRFTSEPAHNGDGHGWDAYRHFGQVHEAWERFAMSIAPATAKNGAKRRGERRRWRCSLRVGDIAEGGEIEQIPYGAWRPAVDRLDLYSLSHI